MVANSENGVALNWFDCWRGRSARRVDRLAIIATVLNNARSGVLSRAVFKPRGATFETSVWEQMRIVLFFLVHGRAFGTLVIDC
jgi:hypothetical protein